MIFSNQYSSRKKTLTIAALSLLSIFIIFFLMYIYGFFLALPQYNNQYFTQEHIQKYASPERTFQLFMEAQIHNDKGLYQEVLGRQMTEKELKSFKPFKGAEPNIETINKNNKSAYIITDNNWGLNFERVNGRWVFTPEDWGVLIREFFRDI